MDTDTRGDPPTSLPASGGTPPNISLLAQFLLGLASGGLTFKAAQWLFNELAWYEGDYDLFGRPFHFAMTKRLKRFLAYPFAFALAVGALALAAWLGYVEWNSENVFGACLAAFATSQALHGALGLQPEAEPIAPFVWGK